MEFLRLVGNWLLKPFRLLGRPGALGAGTAVVALVAGYAVLWQRDEALSADTGYIQAEIRKLDKSLAEINALKDQISTLLARKRVVEVLHGGRIWAPQLLELLARQRSDGVYFVGIDQSGPQVRFTGYAASYGAVAKLVNNLDVNPLLGSPLLTEIRTETAPRVRNYPIRFSLSTRARDATGASPAGAPGPGVRSVHPGDPK